MLAVNHTTNREAYSTSALSENPYKQGEIMQTPQIWNPESQMVWNKKEEYL